MAEWTGLVDTQLDPDAPLTSELAYAWRDNPIAIAEGAVGAPRVMGRALSNVFMGSQTIGGGGNADFINIIRYGRFMIDGVFDFPLTGVRNLNLSTSTDNGATWVSRGAILSSPSAGWTSGKFSGYFDIVSGVSFLTGFAGGGGTWNTVLYSGTQTPSANGNNAIRITNPSGAATSSSFNLYCIGAR